jgi:hypothetical protein
MQSAREGPLVSWRQGPLKWALVSDFNATPAVHSLFRGTGQEVSNSFHKRVLVLAGGAFMSLVGIFGIWVWHEPEYFGPASILCASDAVVVYMPLFGNLRVALGSGSLRACYLVLYGVFLALVIPFFVLETLLPGCLFWTKRPASKYPKTPFKLIFLNLATIFEIEFTLRENAHLQTGEMGVWDFGQVLALLLVIMPVRDVYRAISASRTKALTGHEDRDAVTMLPVNAMEKIGSFASLLRISSC